MDEDVVNAEMSVPVQKKCPSKLYFNYRDFPIGHIQINVSLSHEYYQFMMIILVCYYRQKCDFISICVLQD